MRYLIATACLLLSSLANGEANEEVIEWRRRVGLPIPIVDKDLTAFAQMKAEYRATHNLKDGHDGPKYDGPYSYGEGTGEATAEWGWLTCCIEQDFTHFGAGIYKRGNERFMVLLVRGGTGRALISRHNIPIHDTSYLTTWVKPPPKAPKRIE